MEIIPTVIDDDLPVITAYAAQGRTLSPAQSQITPVSFGIDLV
jgi:hypothetical protein